ncbi:putative membrane associated protein [Granulibacter bethesdensis]|uniref:Membrane associated protein n=2 Tax=Granulibacter bethesdensis TaxID=364410 RepID=A0AAN0RFN0_9PROT|nr:putative membrane associated protein [Granulibacter bethesdensis]AHJ65338.1 putative membrane associated protein [Granulibacter bethesdensis CGDNIH4]
MCRQGAFAFHDTKTMGDDGMSHDHSKPGPDFQPSVTLIQAHFDSDEAVQAAIDRVMQAGIDRGAISLTNRANAQAGPDGSVDAPTTETDHRQLRTLGAGVAAAAGAMAAAGAVVATGGAALPVVGAALAGGAIAGGAAEGIGQAASHAGHEKRETAAEANALILSVSVQDTNQQYRAERALSEAGGTSIHRVEKG